MEMVCCATLIATATATEALPNGPSANMTTFPKLDFALRELSDAFPDPTIPPPLFDQQCALEFAKPG
jgi:hypothetical protein